MCIRIRVASSRFAAVVKHVPEELHEGPLFEALASCHALLRLDGELVGDPSDVKLFEATKWVRWTPIFDRPNLSVFCLSLGVRGQRESRSGRRHYTSSRQETSGPNNSEQWIGFN